MRLFATLSALLSLCISFAQSPLIYSSKTDAQCNGSTTGSIQMRVLSKHPIDSIGINSSSVSGSALPTNSGYSYARGFAYQPTAIAIDSKENTYAIINYNDSIQIEGAWYFASQTSSSVQSFVLVKHNPVGEIVYVKNATTGNLPIKAEALSIDPLDNVYVGGSFSYSASFNGVSLQQSTSNLESAWLMKLSSTGLTQWTRRFYGPSFSWLKNLDATTTSLTIALQYRGNLTLENGTANPTNIIGGSFNGIILMDFNFNGTMLWHQTGRTVGTSGDFKFKDIAVNQQNVYILTEFNAQSQFGGSTVGNSGAFYSLGALFCVDKSNGSIKWAKNIGCDFSGNNCSQVYPYAIATANNHIFLSGNFNSSFSYGSLNYNTTGAGNTNGTFLLCTDTLGNGVWIKGIKDANLNNSGSGTIRAIEPYQDSLLLIGGGLAESANFLGTVINNPYSYSDNYWAVVSQNGTLKSYTIWGDNSSEYVSSLAISQHGSFAMVAMNPDTHVTNQAGIQNFLNGQYHFIAKHDAYFMDTLFQSLAAGNYVLKAASNTSQVTQNVAIVQSTAMNISKQKTDILCHGDSTGSIQVSNNGGTSPYAYSWQGPNGFQATTASIAQLAAGQYVLTITDAQNCVATDTTDILQPIAPLGNQFQITQPFCGFCNGQIQSAVSGGTLPYTYQWTGPSLTAYSNSWANGACDTTYMLLVTDSNACTLLDSAIVTPSAQCDSVWPGDINSDGIANNLDIVYWAMAFGAQGPTRPNASMNWVGQVAPNWSGNMGSNINNKHADCNGDGIIHLSDTSAVAMHYGLTHPKNPPHTKSNARLRFEVDSSQIQINGQDFEIPVLLYFESNSGGADRLFGLVFQLALQNSDSLKLSYQHQAAWFGTGSNAAFYTYRISNNIIDIALAKTDQTATVGNGKIASILVQGKLKERQIPGFDLKILNKELVQLDGSTESLQADSVVKVFHVGIATIDPQLVALIYPNPAKTQVTIYAKTLENQMADVELYSIDGKKILCETLSFQQGNTTWFFKENIPTGTYIMQLSSKNGLIRQLIQIQH